jgi:hypothetical protein
VKCGAPLTDAAADIVGSSVSIPRPREPTIKPIRVSIVPYCGSSYEVGRAGELASEVSSDHGSSGTPFI